MKKIFVLLLACFMLLGVNTPLDVFASTSKVWSYVDAPEDMIEGTTGTWSGIDIDATANGAKFNKRVDNQDIQINAQTKLIIPVESHQEELKLHCNFLVEKQQYQYWKMNISQPVNS